MPVFRPECGLGLFVNRPSFIWFRNHLLAEDDPACCEGTVIGFKVAFSGTSNVCSTITACLGGSVTQRCLPRACTYLGVIVLRLSA